MTEQLLDQVKPELRAWDVCVCVTHVYACVYRPACVVCMCVCVGRCRVGVWMSGVSVSVRLCIFPPAEGDYGKSQNRWDMSKICVPGSFCKVAVSHGHMCNFIFKMSVCVCLSMCVELTWELSHM